MIWKRSQYNFDAKMPIIMGILNLTPDSFSDGGSYPTPEDAIVCGLQMVEEGALIIDVGGESTRSGATPVSEEEECARVLDVVKALASKGICVSIDTSCFCCACGARSRRFDHQRRERLSRSCHGRPGRFVRCGPCGHAYGRR